MASHFAGKAMEARNFVDHLVSVGVPGISVENSEYIEWMYENELYSSFLNFIQNSVTSENLLSTSELSELEEFQITGKLLSTSDLEKACKEVGLSLETTKLEEDPLELNKKLQAEITNKQAELAELQSFLEFYRLEDLSLKADYRKPASYKENLDIELKVLKAEFEKEKTELIQEIEGAQSFIDSKVKTDGSNLGKSNVVSFMVEKNFVFEVEQANNHLNSWIESILKTIKDVGSMYNDKIASCQIKEWAKTTRVLKRCQDRMLLYYIRNKCFTEALQKFKDLETGLRQGKSLDDLLHYSEKDCILESSLGTTFHDLKSMIQKNFDEQDNATLNITLLEDECVARMKSGAVLRQISNYLLERVVLLSLPINQIRALCINIQNCHEALCNIEGWLKSVSNELKTQQVVMQEILHEDGVSEAACSIKDLMSLVEKLDTTSGKSTDVLSDLRLDSKNIQDNLENKVNIIKKMDEVKDILNVINEVVQLISVRSKKDTSMKELEESVRKLASEYERQKEMEESDDLLKAERLLWIHFILNRQDIENKARDFINSGGRHSKLRFLLEP